MTWHFIETAPQDGTPFLAYCPKGIQRNGYNQPPEHITKICLCWWGHPNDYQRRDLGWISADVLTEIFSGSELTGSWTEYEFARVEPTHWMPIPKAPE